MKSIIIFFAFIGISVCQGANRISFLETGQIECEGSDVSNYTYIAQWTYNETCLDASYEGTGTYYLISCQQNGQKSVIALSVLAESGYPAGALYHYEVLYLAESGNLEGKYVYLKEIGLQQAYFKKCSSVLGYTYTSFKNQVLLIADKLDPNIFLNPTGAFEPFKKSATTICKGTFITV